MGRRLSLDQVRIRQEIRSEAGRGRPRPQARARRKLHQQFLDRRARRVRRREVGLDHAVLDPKPIASGERGVLMITAIRTGMAEIGRRKKILWTWYGMNLLCAIAIIAPMMFAI